VGAFIEINVKNQQGNCAMEVIDYLKGLFQKTEANTTDINTKVLRKDKPDSTQYPLTVAPSSNLDNAVTKAELVAVFMGGFLRPYRIFFQVKATPVSASMRTGQKEAITDVLGLGMVYKITKIQVATITAPSLTSTITVKSNGVAIFSTTMVLGAAPVVGKLLDLLGAATTQPGNLTLPAVLTVEATSGTFEVLVDGVLI
jgi:hypothetical protein